MPEPAVRPSNPSPANDVRPHRTCIPQPAQRDLPAAGSERTRTLLKRGLLLKCPYCGQGGIITYPFWIKECCPRCGYRFEPEPGYFVGGYAINLVGAEIIGVIIIVIILLRSNLSLYEQEALAIGTAILLPVILFPWSRTMWMALDLIIQGDSHIEHEQRLT